uniref:Dynein heavy chain hydrolytic ATP-binding dynein motor region domain-containing protein n=1 Tax=Kryptolebias marmoratus TaxID=37003 RepID=A0A3Q3ADT6_KRYMA
MTSGVVQQMLLGALQSGAWLLLESVDLLRQHVLFSLGQLLADIHQFFRLQKLKSQRANDEPENVPDERFTDCQSTSDPECHIVLLGKKISPISTVILIGPAGSGKSACYKTLAGALNRLASSKEKNVPENENMIKRETSHADPPSSVNGSKTEEALIMKWLVMDGEPVGQPSWLDYLTTLFSSQDPYFCLPSGETLLSQPHLSLLMEITDLQDASPSAVTRCSLIYFTGGNRVLEKPQCAMPYSLLKGHTLPSQ